MLKLDISLKVPKDKLELDEAQYALIQTLNDLVAAINKLSGSMRGR